MAEVCSGVLSPGIDYVYSSNRLGTQSYISSILNDNFEHFRQLTASFPTNCINHVLRLICLYYLPPCGTATQLQSPSSICQEECIHIQDTCHATWQAAMLVFNNIDPFLTCEDTGKILFPLPNCCTGAGIQLHTTAGQFCKHRMNRTLFYCLLININQKLFYHFLPRYFNINPTKSFTQSRAILSQNSNNKPCIKRIWAK